MQSPFSPSDLSTLSASLQASVRSDYIVLVLHREQLRKDLLLSTALLFSDLYCYIQDQLLLILCGH